MNEKRNDCVPNPSKSVIGQRAHTKPVLSVITFFMISMALDKAARPCFERYACLTGLERRKIDQIMQGAFRQPALIGNVNKSRIWHNIKLLI